MSIADRMRTITSAKAEGTTHVALTWSDGVQARVDLAEVLKDRSFAALTDPAEFAQVQIGEWGHSLAWPSGAALGAETLWLATLGATGHADARAFLEWRFRHGLSLSKAAEALGVSRRMIAYYSNGEKAVPKSIQLACRGWEASDAA